MSAIPEAFLQASHLRARGVVHGFATAVLGDAVRDLPRWEQATGLAASQLLSLRQVHGVRVFVPEQDLVSPIPGSFVAEADALVSDQAGWVLGVRTADCVPILIHDGKRGVAAAVHAGWRGTVAGVVTKALTTMRDAFACRPKDLLVAIGPCIRGSCYRVGPEVAQAFQERFGSDRVVLKDPDGMRVDLVEANRMQLCQAGIQAQAIEVVGPCTHCSPWLHSYRRDGELAGRQLAFIRPGIAPGG